MDELRHVRIKDCNLECPKYHGMPRSVHLTQRGSGRDGDAQQRLLEYLISRARGGEWGQRAHQGGGLSWGLSRGGGLFGHAGGLLDCNRLRGMEGIEDRFMLLGTQLLPSKEKVRSGARRAVPRREAARVPVPISAVIGVVLAANPQSPLSDRPIAFAALRS